MIALSAMARSTPKPKSTIYVIQSAGSSRAIFDNSNLHHLNCLAISRGLDPIFGYSGMWFRQEKKIEKCSCRSITKSNRKETQQLVRIRKQKCYNCRHCRAYEPSEPTAKEPPRFPDEDQQQANDAVEREEEQEEQRH